MGGLKLVKIKFRRIAKAAGAAATGNPLGVAGAMTQGPPPTPSKIVLEALESDEVQQALADFVMEVVNLSASPENIEAPSAEPVPFVQAPPDKTWPYSILYMEHLGGRIKQSEGFRPDVHLVKGIPHVGWGHNCSTDSIPDDQQQLGVTMSEKLCQELFDDDLDDAKHKARRVCRQMGCQLEGFPPPVAEALVEMHYQMGSCKWQGMFKHLIAGDYAEAAREALRSGLVAGKPSAWWIQTPNRAAAVAPLLSNKQVWFEVGPEKTFADGAKGPAWIEHPWQDA